MALTSRATAWRLFLTVWLVYALHLTSNVARETYLAMAIAERGTVRVDPYLGLHPDLFEIPGRGSYINSNPGASLFGALPWLLARPAVAALFAVKPELAQPKPPTSYDDPRPNRTRLMNRMRERGLDVRLALGAFATQLGMMAPLGALAAVAVFLYLRRLMGDEKKALFWSLVYAFATPTFFRAAFLNQNAILAHLTLFAWLAMAPGVVVGDRGRAFIVGVMMGLGLLMDYAAAPLALVFGLWVMAEGGARAGPRGAVTDGAWCIAGALGPLALLLGYQWAAFGTPWFPAQRYMPPTQYSVIGWNGMTWPTGELLWRNLLDARYGLFAFCPMLIAAFAAPFIRSSAHPPIRSLVFSYLAFVALWLFNSANMFAMLQWNTGVRYMVPGVPLLFFAMVAVLERAPRWLAALLIVPTFIIGWAVAMMREDVIGSLIMLVEDGPQLPMLIVLRKTAQAYAPWLGETTWPFAVAAYLALAAMLWLVWRYRRRPLLPSVSG